MYLRGTPNNAVYYSDPPAFAVPFVWQLELSQRTVDRTNFPTYMGLWGEYSNNPSYRQPIAKQAISQWRNDLKPFGGMRLVSTVNSAPRRMIDAANPAVDYSPSAPVTGAGRIIGTGNYRVYK